MTPMNKTVALMAALLLASPFAVAQKKKTSGSTKTETKVEYKEHREEQKMEHSKSSSKESSIFETSLKEANITLAAGSLESAKNSTVINLAGDFHLLIKPQIQAGGQAVISSQSGSATAGKTYMGFYAMGSYNLDANNIHDSIFFRGGLGLVDAGLAGSAYTATIAAGGTATGDTDKKFSIKLIGGKRFKMWDHIDLTPYGEIEKIGDFDAIIRIVPVSVSILY
ncbi:MAG: hypothetical protein BroJett040_11070 [Oligoflexia bacterium]|nr:MAG: hypothetical protein BroJett040_11070 [Oligoflexia bacterium]